MTRHNVRWSSSSRIRRLYWSARRMLPWEESQHMDHFKDEEQSSIRRTILGLSPELRLTNLAERRFMIWPQDWQRTTYWWQQPVHSWLWSWERTNCTTATSHWLHCHYRQTATWRMNIHITGWSCSHWRYVFHWRYVWIFILVVAAAVSMNIHITGWPCSHWRSDSLQTWLDSLRPRKKSSTSR